MEVIYMSEALKDRDFWLASGNIAIQKKISKLINDICQHPYTGIGKPEELKYNLSGLWSRRIDKANRIVYKVSNDSILVLSMKGHY